VEARGQMSIVRPREESWKKLIPVNETPISAQHDYARSLI
jgi:hypothetical protein